MVETIDPALHLWSRAQFALTACYHWLFVPLTLGITYIMAIMETIYYRTGDEFWKRTTQFWMKLFGINFAIGVATGIILEFEFGTNWSNYSWFVGDIFGAPLAIEGMLAFFMESTFIAVMFFGWEKVSKRFHLIATWLTAIGASLSAWWILVANAWMQHPTGVVFNPTTVRNEMMDFFAVAFQPRAVLTFAHTMMSGWVTGAIFVVGISAWYLIRGRHKRFATKSIRIATYFGLIGAIFLAGAGDAAGVKVAEQQPMKLAAMEGLKDGSKSAALTLVPGVEVPGALSILATHSLDGYVPGINDILNGGWTNKQGELQRGADERIAEGKRALQAFADYRTNTAAADSLTRLGQHEAAATHRTQATADSLELQKRYTDFGYGYLDSKEELVPNVTLVFWAFRVMVGVGGLLILVFGIYSYLSYRQVDLTQKKFNKLHWLAFFTIFATWIAGQAGWIVTEVGRQPWAIQDLLPVKAAVSHLSVNAVRTTFTMFAILFVIMLVVELRIMIRAIKQGPEMHGTDGESTAHTTAH